jgi:hypothetical protein
MPDTENHSTFELSESCLNVKLFPGIGIIFCVWY